MPHVLLCKQLPGVSLQRALTHHTAGMCTIEDWGWDEGDPLTTDGYVNVAAMEAQICDWENVLEEVRTLLAYINLAMVKVNAQHSDLAKLDA